MDPEVNDAPLTTDPPAADPALEREAREMGWVPKDRFRGDEAKWIPAEEFVRRGHEVMPILRKNNERLMSEMAGLKAALAESKQSMEDFKSFQADFVKSRLAQERARITAELKTAREEGNTEREVELIDELTEVKAEEKAKPPSKPNGVDVKAPEADPAFLAWKDANPWFGKDRRKTALALGIAQELSENERGLMGQDFFDRVSEELEATLGAPRARASKVEGGGAPPSGRGGSSDSFSGLPPEAQAQAKADAKRFVGPNKMFKTDKEWYDHFTRLYNEA